MRLLHFSALAWNPAFPFGGGYPERIEQAFRLLELQVTGADQDDHYGRSCL